MSASERPLAVMHFSSSTSTASGKHTTTSFYKVKSMYIPNLSSSKARATGLKGENCYRKQISLTPPMSTYCTTDTNMKIANQEDIELAVDRITSNINHLYASPLLFLNSKQSTPQISLLRNFEHMYLSA